MIAIIFEVEPHDGKKQTYMDLAASLRPELEKIDGFISVERFQSLTNENKLLSLSFFRDEKAVEDWRNVQQHRSAQAAGRRDIFENYRIRVVSVLRDYGMNERDQAPVDSQARHDT